MTFLAAVLRDGVAATTEMMTVMPLLKAEQQNERTKWKVGADICFFSLQIVVRLCKEQPLCFQRLANGRLIISEQVQSAASMLYRTTFSGCAPQHWNKKSWTERTIRKEWYHKRHFLKLTLGVLWLDKSLNEFIRSLGVKRQGVVQRQEVRTLFQESLLQTNAASMEILLYR